MAYGCSRLPSHYKKENPITWYVPYAFVHNYSSLSGSFKTNGLWIKSKDHLLGFTDQSGYKVIFTCHGKGLSLKRHVKALNDALNDNNIIEKWDGQKYPYRILPYCPSCGENPPIEYIDNLRRQVK